MKNIFFSIFLAIVSSFLYDIIKITVNHFRHKPIQIKKIHLSIHGLVFFSGFASLLNIVIIGMLLFILPERYYILIVFMELESMILYYCFSSLLKRYYKIKSDLSEQTRNNN